MNKIKTSKKNSVNYKKLNTQYLRLDFLFYIIIKMNKPLQMIRIMFSVMFLSRCKYIFHAIINLKIICMLML